MSTLAIVLVGGESSRMGRPKHLLTLPDGTVFADAVLRTLAKLSVDLMIVGDPQGYVPDLRVPRREDLHAGVGPLGGVAAALDEHLDYARLLVATCDAPLAPRGAFERLLATPGDAAAFVGTDGALLPLPCVVDRAKARVALADALAKGALGVGALLRRLDVKTTPVDDETRALLTGVNTDAEYRALLAGASGAR